MFKALRIGEKNEVEDLVDFILKTLPSGVAVKVGEHLSPGDGRQSQTPSRKAKQRKIDVFSTLQGLTDTVKDFASVLKQGAEAPDDTAVALDNRMQILASLTKALEFQKQMTSLAVDVSVSSAIQAEVDDWMPLLNEAKNESQTQRSSRTK